MLHLPSLSCLVFCWTVACISIAPAEESLRFNRDIRPLLSQHCFRCHGPDAGERKADLRLDLEEGVADMFAGGLDESEAWRRINSTDPEEQMPPPKSHLAFTAPQKQRIRKWVEQGAPWEGHWAFIPPQQSTPPPGENPVDAFIDRQLQTQGVQPVAAADRITLIRRLSLDLTGLPPTPEQVAAFVADSSPTAYEKVVDRLLASPAYGERMAVYWLDLVRYADSVGYHKDSHRDCWLYRDYVVKAFNENKPYDQFVREQLAGDLLSGDRFQEYEWKIASGFNRLIQTTSEGGAQAKEYLAKYSADRVRNTSAIFLGSTMGCTECHDHKYDPFSTKDFYSFAAFFADVSERGVGYPAHTPIPSFDQMQQWQTLEKELAALRESKPASDEQTAKIAELEAQLAAVSDAKSWPKTLVTTVAKPRTIRLLPRGNWLDDTGPVMSPAIPEFLGDAQTEGDRLTRLDLANWIVDRGNPLAARVMVNRLWKISFGVGLARTLDDLGSQGEWPTHPQLLDWLAVDFMQHGWDVKRTLKQIVMSNAYQRRSYGPAELMQRDPENRLFARQSRFRLSAEMVRDNALAVSGLLSLKRGGPSVKPYQPANYWYRLYKDGKYTPSSGADQHRRGLYTYWRRSFWHPSLRAFDAPAREECVAERPRSNTPAQSLVLLNDPTYVEAARVLATRMMEAEDSTPARIAYGFRRAVARPPTTNESTALGKLYALQHARYKQDEQAAKSLLQVGESPTPEEAAFVELAAWTNVARAILNLHETITRE